MKAVLASTNTKLQGLVQSKWMVLGLLGLGIILLILNLFVGGDSAPVNPTTVEAPAVDAVEAPAAPAIDLEVNTEGFFASIGEGNFWLAMTIILAILMTANWASKLMKEPPAKVFDKASKTWVENKNTNPVPRFKASFVWLIAGVLMVVVGLWGIYPAFFGENNEISEIFGELGLFDIIAVGAIAITLVVGAVKYMGIAGNASAYFFMVGWVLLVFFAILYLIGIFLAPDATTLIIEAVKNDAQSAAASIVETTEETSSIKWEALFDPETWTNIAIIAILTLAPVVVFHQYISKNKLVVVPVAIVAMMILFGSIYKILIEYEPAREVIEDVSGALGAANEKFNPTLGESLSLRLYKDDLGRASTISLGMHDDLTVFVPEDGYALCIDASASFKRRYEDRGWFDPTHVVDITSYNRNMANRLTVAEAMKPGLKAEGIERVTYTIILMRTGGVCNPQ
ncbi:MAG: hypothetical protein ACK4SL_02560 [Candidatus Paceibacteria bacterium]